MVGKELVYPINPTSRILPLKPWKIQLQVLDLVCWRRFVEPIVVGGENAMRPRIGTLLVFVLCFSQTLHENFKSLQMFLNFL